MIPGGMHLAMFSPWRAPYGAPTYGGMGLGVA